MNNTEFLNEYKSYLFENKGSKNTAQTYFSKVESFFKETEIPLSDLNQKVITEFIEKKSKELKPSTARIFCASIKDFLMFMESDIVLDIQFQREKRVIQPIPTEADFKKILFAMGENTSYGIIRNKAILSLLYHSGLRIDESRVLELDDVDLDEKFIYVFGKGSKRRAVPINETLHKVLSEYFAIRLTLKGTNHLFLSSGKNHKNEIISYGAFRQIIKRACSDAGFSHLSPYCFRHSFCTRLIRSGFDFQVIAALMGHSDTSSLSYYYVPDGLDGREAVQALSF